MKKIQGKLFGKDKRKYFGVISTIFIISILCNSFSFADVSDLESVILNQIATQTGSNNNKVTFSTGVLNTSFVNKSNNTDIILDYFKGYYYDKLFGFFKLDWNSDSTQNVRIIGSTTKCSSGYGYKLGGYAKSDTAGKIKFDYDNNNFVYYCIIDKKLHGKAYSDSIGFQSFEGIYFDLIPNITISGLPLNNEHQFVNNSSVMFISGYNGYGFLAGEKKSIKYGEETMFYIWKPKIK